MPLGPAGNLGQDLGWVGARGNLGRKRQLVVLVGLSEQYLTSREQIIRAFTGQSADARVRDAVAKTEVLFATRQVGGHRVEHADQPNTVSVTELCVDELLNAHPVVGLGVTLTGEHGEQAMHRLFGPSPAPIAWIALTVVAQAARAIRLAHAFLIGQ